MLVGRLLPLGIEPRTLRLGVEHKQANVYFCCFFLLLLTRTKLAGQVLDGGGKCYPCCLYMRPNLDTMCTQTVCVCVSDYDFQIALMEALCRMATPAQRREMVHRWFSMDYVAKAFITIRDSEFETVQTHTVTVKNITPTSMLQLC